MRHARFVIPTALTVVAAGVVVPLSVAAGAASPAPAPVAPQAVTRLASVTGLEVAPSASGERLHWSDPAGEYAAIVVRRALGLVAPASPTSGTAIANLEPGTSSLVDTSVEARAVYSYSVFVTYSGGRHASPAVRQARSAATLDQPAVRPGSGTFSGTVTDGAGDPLKNVEVVASPAFPYISTGGNGGFGFFFSSSRPVRTAADGTFTLKGIDTASYTVCYVASTQAVTGGDSTALGYEDVCPPDAVEGHVGVDTSLGTTALPDNPGGVITGKVVDAVTQAPIAGVQVDIQTEYQPIGVVQTNAKGVFRVALPVGSYEICYDATIFATSVQDGYLSTCSDQAVTVTAGRVTTVVQALATGGVVTGVVRSSVDGSPVPDLDVTGSSDGGFAETTTDANGAYTLSGLGGRTQICTDSSFFFDTSSLGFGSSCITVKARPGKTVAAPDIVATPAGGISGTVMSSSGHPLGNVNVEVSGRRGGFGTNTAPDGTYEVAGLTAGVYTVCFQDTTYPVQCYRNEAPENLPNPVRVTSGALTTGIDATIVGRDPGNVAVTVQDSHGNKLVGANAVLVQKCGKQSPTGCFPAPVFALPNNTVVASDITVGAGIDTFAGVAPGIYGVCAFGRYAVGGTSTTRYQDGCTDSYSVTVSTGRTAAVTITLSDGAAVAGTVTDKAGHPLGGVVVSAGTGEDTYSSQPDTPVVTAADGTYRVEGLPAGTTTICFDATTASGPSPTGYASACYLNAQTHPTAITVTNGVVTTGIDQQLKAGGAITGTVTGPDGAPEANVDVQIFEEGDPNDPGAPNSFASTGADGTYEVSGLPAGVYEVCFFTEGVADAPPTGYVDQCYLNATSPDEATPISVGAGKTVSGIDATLQVGAEFTGEVTSGGQPLEFGILELFGAGQGPKTDGIGTGIEGGGYDLTGVPAGTYAVCFDATVIGLSAQCYNDVAWKGGAHLLPAGITKVTVAPGDTETIDADLT